MEKFSKEELTRLLCEIADRGLMESARHGNVGGIGNTIEDLLEIKENNFPIPNAAEWELKTYRTHSKSLTTLFHMEPSPLQLLNLYPLSFLNLTGGSMIFIIKQGPNCTTAFLSDVKPIKSTVAAFQDRENHDAAKNLIRKMDWSFWARINLGRFRC